MIGPVLDKGLTLHLNGEIISRPYIDLTLCTMREFGADAEWISVDTIEVKPKPYSPTSYYIENDWSAASYWYEMVALSKDRDAEVKLEGLMDGSKQGDSSVRYIFSLLGVKTTFKSKRSGVPTTVTLKKSSHRVPRLEYDFGKSPTLKIKETNRIAALKKEMAKLGFDIVDINDSELMWDGKAPRLSSLAAPVTIDTYDDHRMALSFAPLCLRRPVIINQPQVVSKSYPRFWDDLRQAGVTVEG